MNHNYQYLTTNEQVESYFNQLKERNCTRLALDLEGDQGTVHYHNSISILQIFDGKHAVIIDVLALDKKDAVLAFLTSKEIIKVMFASSNDLFMAQNVLNCTIENIRDIAVAQKMLNQPVNLARLIGIEKEDKDSLQRANWVKRPITPHLLEYAINDVMELLRIEEELTFKLRHSNILTTYEKNCLELSRQEYRIDPLYVYSRRIGSYNHMPPRKKLLLRTIWIVRELIGLKLDRPVGLLFSKKLMPFWVRKEMDIKGEILLLVNKKLKPEQHLTKTDMNTLWEKAHELASKAAF